ncbi:hypothetical protein M5K25_002214 [Dendrobium thyrsiflorum]|uniref:Uncharacterized protein n=1 Tax=Dendrobium thyrsiflorum TaxID=117978 RepID=A0ABD0W1Q8_DENTH
MGFKGCIQCLVSSALENNLLASTSLRVFGEAFYVQLYIALTRFNKGHSRSSGSSSPSSRRDPSSSRESSSVEVQRFAVEQRFAVDEQRFAVEQRSLVFPTSSVVFPRSDELWTSSAIEVVVPTSSVAFVVEVVVPSSSRRGRRHEIWIPTQLRPLSSNSSSRRVDPEDVRTRARLAVELDSRA